MKQPNHTKIPLEAIKSCTENFNERNFIGKGGYGSVYKGILTWGDHVNQVVAVKQLNANGFQGFLTKESDVYSFGVVLFEVLCGRLACDFNYNDDRRFLHHLARTCYKNGDLDKIIDHRIRKDIKPNTLLKFSATVYQCLQKAREKRPTIAEVAFQLKEAMKTQVGT
ncbi:hypothetical protein L1887_18284 [Cichorium endivia]|nr:hypothetical protein L1887_18284 [Cichorium endivia]